MSKRFLVLLAAACGLLVAADAEPHVSFSSPSKVGASFLPAGLYRVRVQGNLVFLTGEESKKSYTALVKVEKLAKPASFTAAQAHAVDGVNRIDSIVFQGGDTKLVF